MKKLEGLIAAAYTPFDWQGHLNTSVVPHYADYLQRCGLRGVFVNGTTGEGASLTTEERKMCAEAWVRQKDDRFKVIIHVGHNSIEISKQLAAHAQDIQADAIGAMAPGFLRTENLQALLSFIAAIADAAPGLPLYYYHLPAMTGAHYDMIDLLALTVKRIPNLAGIKFTHGDLMDMRLCIAFAEGKYDILHGKDEILTCGLALGAKGAIGSTYNFIAPLFTRIMSAFEEGNILEADALQLVAMRIIKVLYAHEGALKSGKYCMQFLGLDLGAPRLPLTEMAPASVHRLKKALEELQFFTYALDRNGP